MKGLSWRAFCYSHQMGRTVESPRGGLWKSEQGFAQGLFLADALGLVRLAVDLGAAASLEERQGYVVALHVRCLIEIETRKPNSIHGGNPLAPDKQHQLAFCENNAVSCVLNKRDDVSTFQDDRDFLAFQRFV
jgi:hypothetical protein